MKNILLILSLTLSTMAFGHESIASKDSDKIAAKVAMMKKGNHDYMTASSQGTGYEFKFKDGQSAKLWGFGRLYSYPYSNSSKLSMAYFRVYLDGKKSDELSFRVRADYSPYYFTPMEKNTDGTETLSSEKPSSIYFGRAFVTYTPKALKNWTFKAGRLLSLPNKYDVFGYTAFVQNNEGPSLVDTKHTTTPEYHVSEGVSAEYQEGNVQGHLIVTYQAAPNKSNSEEFLYNARAQHTLDFGKTFGKLDYGVTATTTSHNKSKATAYSIYPDFVWSIGDWYALDQMYYRDIHNANGLFKTSEYKYLLRNYFEVGTNFQLFGNTLAPDIYIDTSYYDGVSTSNLGLEAFYYLPKNTAIAASFTYSNIFNEYSAEEGLHKDKLRRISGSIFLQKYF